MKIIEYLTAQREMAYVRRNRPRVPAITPDDDVTIGSLIDTQVARQPNATMLVTVEESITWKEFQALSNKISNILLSKGVKKGDAIALNMENSILYMACVVGISRIGAIVGLINTNLVGAQLVHCVREIETVASVVDRKALGAISDCQEEYKNATPVDAPILFFDDQKNSDESFSAQIECEDANALLADASDAAPELLEPVLSGDRALYVFTSGTTGLPKPAIITHLKYVYGGGGMGVLGFRAKPSDRLYNCLPLYHGTGLIVGAGACLYNGSSMFIRKKFSASSLVKEANQYNCNMLIYIGEICRYLLNTPESPQDKHCRIERIAGNGLRPDIWKKFRARFGIKRIGEFYGAGEANGGFMNVFNKDETIGFTSSNIRLVEYSTEDATALRGTDGFLKSVKQGEPGLMLIEVNEKDRFDGYKNAEQSEKKVIRNAFAEGDCWFNSGDVLKEIDVGWAFNLPHYQFVDRLGDTFRWKSENVSTNEVAEILCAHEPIEFACVYGVSIPGAEGKAGMATVKLADGTQELNLEGFGEYVEANLPRYAHPLFVRIKRDFDFTGTHKVKKTDLVKEAYDFINFSDPVYALDPKKMAYTPLEEVRYRDIMEGRAGY
ncbi:MAG: long-chain-acyl-CoA synthetase [Pseudomonadota bacterium]